LPVAIAARRHGFRSISRRVKIQEFLIISISLIRSYRVVAYENSSTCAFGHAPLGAVNVHASLLPKYRGARPSTGRLQTARKNRNNDAAHKRELDAGDVLLTCTTPIDEVETARDLHDSWPRWR